MKRGMALWSLFSVNVLAAGLPISGYAHANSCHGIHTVVQGSSLRQKIEWQPVYGSPKGLLVKENSSANLSFFRDENGRSWHLLEYNQLTERQVDLEIVSARVFRSLGYFATEIYLIEMDGNRYAASLLTSNGKLPDPLNAVTDTKKFRALRVVAAFLKPDINGSLLETSDLQKIYDSFDVSGLSENHPWRKINRDDIDYAVELLRELDYRKITEIAGFVNYTYDPRRQSQKLQMQKALTARRDALLDGLRHHLNPEKEPITTSYWAKKETNLPLSFEVNENRPQAISSDIRNFVDTLQVPKGFRVLFRGQEHLTENVLSPMARQDKAQRRLKTEKEQEQTYHQSLMAFQMGTYSGTIPTARNEARKYIFHSQGQSESDYNQAAWWDRATPVDALAMYHTSSNGDPMLVSATRDLAIASRYVKFPRVEYKYRYIYILLIPDFKIVPVFESIKIHPGAPNKGEKENAILYDATSYVKAIYDSESGLFIKN